MPFQALPIAHRTNTGDPLSKLVWIFIVARCRLDGALNGKAGVRLHLADMARFSQATIEEVRAALKHLERLDLCYVIAPFSDEFDLLIDVELPVSSLSEDERRRIKASPDQVEAMAVASDFTCAACGNQNPSYDDWHVDHIIPRSVGGADVEQNLQLLCGPCNSRKGNRVHWVDFIGGRR